jgi:hypothetical protein
MDLAMLLWIQKLSRTMAQKVKLLTLSFSIEAAAVDSFVDELRRLGTDKAGRACLKGMHIQR